MVRRKKKMFDDDNITSTVQLTSSNPYGKLKIIIPDEIVEYLKLNAGDNIKWTRVFDLAGKPSTTAIAIKKENSS